MAGSTVLPFCGLEHVWKREGCVRCGELMVEAELFLVRSRMSCYLSSNPFTAVRAQSIPIAPSLLNYGEDKLVLYNRLRRGDIHFRTQTSLPIHAIENNILRKYQKKVYETEYYEMEQQGRDGQLEESRLGKSGNNYWLNVRESTSDQILVNPFREGRECRNKDEVRKNTIVRHSSIGQKDEELRKAKSERQLMREELAHLKDKLKSKEKSRPKEAAGLIHFYKTARQAKQTPQRSDFNPSPSFFPSEFSFKRSEITPPVGP